MQHALAMTHTRPHAHVQPPCTHISFSPDISLQDREIHSNYSTNHEHEKSWVILVRGSFALLRFLNFLCQKHVTEKSCYVIRYHLGSKVNVNLSLHLSIYTWRHHNIITKTLANNDRNMSKNHIQPFIPLTTITRTKKY